MRPIAQRDVVRGRSKASRGHASARHGAGIWCRALFLVTVFCRWTIAAEPVSQAIDLAIEARLKQENVEPSPLADDAEFLRRVYFDIVGRPPTYDQATVFLHDTSADKRARLVDELLARPEYGLHFATRLRDLMIDRSSDLQYVRNAFSWEFVTWLAQSLNEDRGYDAIVREMLLAEGEIKTTPAALFLASARMNNIPRPESTVAAATRLFLGIQIGCSQCHDHPYVEEWTQDEFWGLAAFFDSLVDQNLDGNGGSQNPSFSEKPISDPEKLRRYLGNLKRQAFLPPEPGTAIAVADTAQPGAALRTVPARLMSAPLPELPESGPYRPAFAAWLTSADNPYFAPATVNRLWAHFLGRGLVEPIDDLSPLNQPSHPEVLSHLSGQLRAAEFRLKPVVREICLSRVYQRSSRPPADKSPAPELFAQHALKLLSADQMIDAVAIASGRPPSTGKNRDSQTQIYITKEADAASTEFSHGVPQFLYQMNGYAANNGANYLGKITAQKNVDEALGQLYLSVVSRPPRPAELEKLRPFVAQASNPGQAYRDIYWALINSAEFYFVP